MVNPDVASPGLSADTTVASVPGPLAGTRAPEPVADLTGMRRNDLAAALSRAGVPKSELDLRGTQIRTWIYRKGATSLNCAIGLPKALRARLGESCTIGRPEIARRQLSVDGTRKYLLRLGDGSLVETVYIPEPDRGTGTLCLSSQVGCTLTCRFCHTGTQRLVRNLTAAEIVGQLLVARDDLGDWNTLPGTGRRITNVVLMGMGEPLFNTDAVIRAMQVVRDHEGIAISRRKITLSTSGVVPEIARVGTEIGCMLAISLHATTDALRDRLIPINRKYPLAELLQACRDYPRLSNAERIIFEYVMLKGVNDSDDDARRLIALIDGIPAKVNLIPFNPWPGAEFECSDPDRLRRFGDIINRAGYSSPVRTPRGADILAACGQLRSDSLRRGRRTLRESPDSPMSGSLSRSEIHGRRDTSAVPTLNRS